MAYHMPGKLGFFLVETKVWMVGTSTIPEKLLTCVTRFYLLFYLKHYSVSSASLTASLRAVSRMFRSLALELQAASPLHHRYDQIMTLYC